MYTRTSKLGGAWRLVFLLVVMALAVAPGAYAGNGEGMCQGDPGGGHGQGGALCAYGPAGCVAIGLRVDVAPNPALPFGASTELARSQANAFAFGPSFAYGHGDAHTASAQIPGTLGSGAIESRCDASAQEQFHYASGDADVSNFYISLYSYSIPVVLWGDVLHETGWSMNGAGANSANVVNLQGVVNGNPIGPVSNTQAPNTAISLGGAGTLYLNEQFVGFTNCPTYSGDAARLVINNPVTGAQIAQVLISWVSTSTCP